MNTFQRLSSKTIKNHKKLNELYIESYPWTVQMSIGRWQSVYLSDGKLWMVTDWVSNSIFIYELIQEIEVLSIKNQVELLRARNIKTLIDRVATFYHNGATWFQDNKLS